LNLGYLTKNIVHRDINLDFLLQYFHETGNKVLSLATPRIIFGVEVDLELQRKPALIRVRCGTRRCLLGLTRLGVWGTDEAAEAASFVSYRTVYYSPGESKQGILTATKIYK